MKDLEQDSARPDGGGWPVAPAPRLGEPVPDTAQVGKPWPDPADPMPGGTTRGAPAADYAPDPAAAGASGWAVPIAEPVVRFAGVELAALRVGWLTHGRDATGD